MLPQQRVTTCHNLSRSDVTSDHVTSVKPRQAGFTLIELLVVISIIVLLTSIGATVFSRAQAGARDGKRKSDLESLRVALEQRFAENKTYINSGSWANVCSDEAVCPTLGALTPDYLKVLPQDPLSGVFYQYQSTSPYQTYCLRANLEVNPSPSPQSSCTGYTISAPYDYGVGNP